jgi:hypothetical protein
MEVTVAQAPGALKVLPEPEPEPEPWRAPKQALGSLAVQQWVICAGKET